MKQSSNTGVTNMQYSWCASAENRSVGSATFQTWRGYLTIPAVSEKLARQLSIAFQDEYDAGVREGEYKVHEKLKSLIYKGSKTTESL